MKHEILDNMNILTNMPKQTYWFDNNPALTNFMMVLSSLFPAGESFFMKSITAYLPQVPQYKNDVVVFCKQERNHSQVHKKLNRLHNRVAVKKLEGLTATLLEGVTKVTSKQQRLIATVVLEHITATLAKRLLKNAELLDMMEQEARDLWVYHAIEETGELHSSIATKVYNEVCNDVSAFEYSTVKTITCIALVLVVGVYQAYLTVCDRKLSGYTDLFNVLFNKRDGIVGHDIFEYLE